MKREQAINLIKKHVKNRNSIKHMLAVEAVMRALAKRFDEDEELWGLAGLLHDIDMEIVDYRNNPEEHGKKGAEILEKEGVSKKVIDAALAHNKATGKKRETDLEKAIHAADPLTGLIVASALIIPSKKINDLTTDSVIKRFKEKSFARGADRETIKCCSEIGLELDKFIEIGLLSMQEISKELEL